MVSALTVFVKGVLVKHKKTAKRGFPSQFKTPSESPGFLLWKVSNLWQQKQREALSKLDLTHVQFVLLAVLGWFSRVEAHVSQASLARHAGTDEMMTSTVVRTLEKKGLLKRLKHPTDTRARVLQLTPRGEQAMGEALKVVEQVDRDFFKPTQSKDLLNLLGSLLSA